MLLKDRRSMCKMWLVRTLGLAGVLVCATPGITEAYAQKRHATVWDAVHMTHVGEPLYAGYKGVGPKSAFASYSPDGKHFGIVIDKAYLEEDKTDYRLLLFRTADAFRGETPKSLTTFSSESNNQGISDLQWLEDNKTILFLGSRGSEPMQLFSVDCHSGIVKKLTNHRTALRAYAASQNGKTIAYVANRTDREVVSRATTKYGMEVTTEELGDLIKGKISSFEPELFMRRPDVEGEDRIGTIGSLEVDVYDLFLSPNGRYLVLKTNAKTLPKAWSAYDDQTIQTAFRRELPEGSSSGLLRYELVDTKTGKAETLLNSPAPFFSSDVLWAPDSKSVVLSGVYLPLDVKDASEFRRRRETRYVVEVTLPSRSVTKISEGDLRPIRWEPKHNLVQFEARSQDTQSSSSEVISFQKIRGNWIRSPHGSITSSEHLPEIRLEQDLNMPPRIVAVDTDTGRKQSLVDLNPDLAKLHLGRVEALQWPDGAGGLVNGGLYLPPDYIPGSRYPLVIQTHGFDPHAFWMDGPWSTAFAAQALASRGMVVLQIDDMFATWLDTAGETEHVMKAYENAIEMLDKKGIIDRKRVGLIGFSRTCLYVKYALTHSRQSFAAAVASDGFDGGYYEYVTAYPLAKSEIESVIGAAPFGSGLDIWLKKSPGFLLDRVKTPIQLQANASVSLFEQWEWFSGLKRLNKPVDLVYLPAGIHILMKPWDRMVSEQKSVDWLCFWLKGEEDPDPVKASQYARWRELGARAGTP